MEINVQQVECIYEASAMWIKLWIEFEAADENQSSKIRTIMPSPRASYVAHTQYTCVLAVHLHSLLLFDGHHLLGMVPRLKVFLDKVLRD